MSVKLKVDKTYEGLDVYKIVNKNNEAHINHYIEQIKPMDVIHGVAILEMLRDLENSLRIELE